MVLIFSEQEEVSSPLEGGWAEGGKNSGVRSEDPKGRICSEPGLYHSLTHSHAAELNSRLNTD